jgi:hypothetical protein
MWRDWLVERCGQKNFTLRVRAGELVERRPNPKYSSRPKAT